MRVIFLDIDGVLNNSTFWHEQHTKDPEKAEWGTMNETGWDPESIRCLNEIVDRTGATIIVSSTWRLRYSECVGCLTRAGINHPGGRTPSHHHGIRGDEIKEWLDNHPEVETFVILDDDSDMREDQKPFFVQTSWKNGLQKEHVDRAVNILLGPNDEELSDTQD